MLIYQESFFLSQRCAAHRGDHFVIEYLGEIETEFKNTLACLSGAQTGPNHENMEVENLVNTLPLGPYSTAIAWMSSSFSETFGS